MWLREIKTGETPGYLYNWEVMGNSTALRTTTCCQRTIPLRLDMQASHPHGSQLHKRDADPVPNYSVTSDQGNVLELINVYLNGASILAACAAIAIFLFMRVYDKKLVDRVSLRLSLAISITDLLSAVSLEAYSFSADLTDSGCKGVVFVLIWFTNQYLFLSVAIAFNLQYLFLHKKLFNPALEKWYYIFSIGLSLLSALIPLTAGRFGYDDAQQICWFTPSNTALSQKWEYGTYLIPIMISVFYCMLVVILVGIKLKQEALQMEKQMFHKTVSERDKEDKPDTEDLRRQKTRQTINRAVRRILLYPIIPFITQTGFVVSELYMYINNELSYPLNLWGVPTAAIPGLCNFIAFVTDPAVSNAWCCVKEDLLAKYGYPNIKGTDSFFRTQPTSDSPSSQLQRGFMPWFVRTFLVASKKSSDGVAFWKMNYFPDSSKISAATQSLKPEYQSHQHPKMSNETNVSIPLQAFSISKVSNTPERNDAVWTEVPEQSIEICEPEVFKHDQWAESESQQAQKLLIGL